MRNIDLVPLIVPLVVALVVALGLVALASFPF
jgi:hypothetical protein